MFRLLDRAMLRDLLRIGLLTTVVLVTVISFGAAIKPLANDRLITVAQAAKYIGLATIPMLQFGLPFAAAFGATLLLHRMTNDNEVLAMSASGIPYRRILRPVALLGLVLLVVMIGLTQWVIPRFWARMHHTIATDIVQVFQRSIERGEPFQVDNLQIHADEIAVQANPPDTNAAVRLRLLRVAAAELDAARRVETDITASQAVVDVYREPGRTLLKLVMTDTVVFTPTGSLARTELVRPEQAIVIPDIADDDLTTMTRGELRALRRDPDRFSDVVEARQALEQALRDGTMLEAIGADLAAGRPAVLVRPGTPPRRYLVEAAGMAGRRFAPRGEVVRISEIEDGTALRRYEFRTARLERAHADRLTGPAWDLQLEDGVVIDLRRDGEAAASNKRARLVIAALAPERDTAADDAPPSSAALLARAEGVENDAVARRAAKLRETLRELDDEIVARMHRRYALATTAPLLLLLGAVLAIWRRNSLPLAVYLWAFVPSILDLVLISSGDQMIRDGHAEGIAVLWSGNTALFALLGFAYWRTARN